MKDEIKTKLAATFEKHAEKLRHATEVKKAEETKEQIFMREFATARDEIIRPAMVEMGEYIKAQGYDYQITTEDEKFDRENHSSGPASIRLTMWVDGPHGDDRRRVWHEHPSFTVFTNKAKQRVTFHESTVSPGRGGYGGSTGDAPISELTQDMVQEKILKTISQVF